jgi:hypothetical protein
MYFHTDNAQTIFVLREALAEAHKRGKIRFATDDKGRLHYKIGEGMWNIINGTPDPYRDGSGL